MSLALKKKKNSLKVLLQHLAKADQVFISKNDELGDILFCFEPMPYGSDRREMKVRHSP